MIVRAESLQGVAPAYHAVSSRVGDLWHTRVNTPGVNATATHGRILDARNWACNLGATTFEVTDHAKLTIFFADAGYARAVKCPGVAGAAIANHRDNFVLWIARTIDEGILVAFDEEDGDHCDWINLYCMDSTRGPRAEGHIPCENNFVIAIANRLYEEYRNQAVDSATT